jgi:basic amino acid/polyamine antiporter, APA family
MGDANAPKLRRELGLWEVTASGVGIIIGAGIYVLIGEAAAEAGNAVWLAFALAATLSILTALSYAELASMFPTAAAEFEYTRHVFPPWAAFLVGWMAIEALVIAAATISLGFGRYFVHFLDVDERLPALVLLAFVAFVATRGISRSARLTVALSAVQIGGLLFVIVIGMPHLGDHDLLAATSFSGVAGGAALVFFAFIGFDEVITLAEETEDPIRTVPRALMLALGISALLYVAVAIASVSVLGADALAVSDRPLADVIGESLGGNGNDFMSALAVISTTNTSLLAITAGSRVMYGMAVRHSLPRFLAFVGKGSGAPAGAILFAVAVAAGFVLLKDLTLIASVTDFAVYISFGAINIALILLRFRQPDRPRAFRVPLAIGKLPLVPLLATATILLMISQLKPEAIALGLVTAVIALIVGWFVGRPITLTPDGIPDL